MARAYGRSVMTEVFATARRAERQALAAHEARETAKRKRRGRVGTVLIDVLCLVMGLACGAVSFHHIANADDGGCRSCVVMSR